MVPHATLEAALRTTLGATDLRGLGAKYEGKVRDNYSAPDGRRFIVVTDRISAFDRVLGTIPFKGQVLNALAAWWFERTRDVAPNHVVGVPASRRCRGPTRTGQDLRATRRASTLRRR